MGGGRRATALGGFLLALCTLVCVGLPLLAAAGIATGFAFALGGAVLAGVVLFGLGVAALLGLRRRTRAEACCILPEQAGAPRSIPTDRRLADAGKR